jgi:cytochrome c oxidase assembly protein subunit 15
MSYSVNNNWLTRFALATAVATLVLIGLGGLVTSHEAGLSVPDWPTTYGYNMFLFPVSKWVGGIFFEHTHRLMASLVGFLTAILAIWLWIKEPRRWMRWLGIAAFFGVVLQGVLGGLRVVKLKDQIGIFTPRSRNFFSFCCASSLFAAAAGGGICW